MAEVLGQRALLGCGVALAWLVLFHLLVNIWMLCVFTSLLVVLGGWLGSQAALESNSVVHLERFITLEPIPPSEEDDRHLDQEIHNTVGKIIRDFVTSWFSAVSSERRFETQVRDAMVSMAMETRRRAGNIDRKELTRRILDMFGCHLQDYVRAKELAGGDGRLLWTTYSGLATPHLAACGDPAELNYTRALVDLLLHVLVPPPHLETQSGRCVVGELITCDVFLPLVDKLSDPDWLNNLLIQMLGESQPKAQEPARKVAPASSFDPPPLPRSPAATAESAPAPQPEAAGLPRSNFEAPPETETFSEAELAAYEVFCGDEEDCPRSRAPEEEEAARAFLERYIRGGKSNPFYQENDSDLDSPSGDFRQSSTDSLVLIGSEEGLFEGRRGGPAPGEDGDAMDPGDHPNGYGTPCVGSLQDLEAGSPPLNLLGLDQAGPGNHGEPLAAAAGSPSQGTPTMPSFSFEPLSSPDGPVLIQNLRITGTITAKEHRGTGSHPYTLYTIKYETAMGCESAVGTPAAPEDAEEAEPAGSENQGRVQPVAYHMVNRRYSEFLNLQTRLEEKNELRKLIKGVKGPKKVFPDMPFGNMDSDKIEARRGLLETFLKLLCAIPEIANSEEMQEFLALNTDARIAFVKKPFIVSRIDKIVVNAIVDTLKTAFPRSEPQSPTEDNDCEVDGFKLTFDKKSKSRLKFSSKLIASMNGSDVRPQVLFSWDQTSTVLNRKSLADLQAFITELEILSVGGDSEPEDSPALSEFRNFLDDGIKEKQECASEMALADVALNILCLLMRDQWSWLCTENVQRCVRLLFGTLINRLLEVGVANLTSTGYWVAYLRAIQEAVWPGGTLPWSAAPERSRQQQDATRGEALRCLMRLLPDLVSDLLGSDKYKLSWETALDSLQDPQINRHLVFSLLDLLLEFLVPEIPEEDFQRRLLATLSKNPEKLLA